MFKAVGAAALLVAGALVPGTATAAVSATCSVGVGSVTPGGDHWGQAVISTRPPAVILSQVTARGVYAPGQVKVSSSMAERDDGFDGVNVSGYVIIGVALYSSGYHAVDGTIDSGGLRRIGGGWGNFVALEEAEYQGPTESGISRVYTYGLRSDGVLFRWNTFGGVWRNKASAPGFAAVKSMALISSMNAGPRANDRSPPGRAGQRDHDRSDAEGNYAGVRPEITGQRSEPVLVDRGQGEPAEDAERRAVGQAFRRVPQQPGQSQASGDSTQQGRECTRRQTAKRPRPRPAAPIVDCPRDVVG